MSISNQDKLNSVVIDYAKTAMEDYILSSEEFKSVLREYYKPSDAEWSKSEAVIRTQGLSRPFVVASCNIEGHDTCFSDYSGKKQRPTVLNEFPSRKMDFRKWYGNNQKPYQHRILYDHINQELGTIGGYANNLKHPIGYCAEQNVANRLMLATDKHFDDIQFSLAIRPKTGEIVPYCDNCKQLFKQLNDAQD
jgi:hypothetical protein